MDALLCKINYAFHKASSKNRLEFHILFEIKLKGNLRVFFTSTRMVRLYSLMFS